MACAAFRGQSPPPSAAGAAGQVTTAAAGTSTTTSAAVASAARSQLVAPSSLEMRRRAPRSRSRTSSTTKNVSKLTFESPLPRRLRGRPDPGANRGSAGARKRGTVGRRVAAARRPRPLGWRGNRTTRTARRPPRRRRDQGRGCKGRRGGKWTSLEGLGGETPVSIPSSSSRTPARAAERRNGHVHVSHRRHRVGLGRRARRRDKAPHRRRGNVPTYLNAGGRPGRLPS